MRRCSCEAVTCDTGLGHRDRQSGSRWRAKGCGVSAGQRQALLPSCRPAPGRSSDQRLPDVRAVLAGGVRVALTQRQ